MPDNVNNFDALGVEYLFESQIDDGPDMKFECYYTGPLESDWPGVYVEDRVLSKCNCQACVVKFDDSDIANHGDVDKHWRQRKGKQQAKIKKPAFHTVPIQHPRKGVTTKVEKFPAKFRDERKKINGFASTKSFRHAKKESQRGWHSNIFYREDRPRQKNIKMDNYMDQ